MRFLACIAGLGLLVGCGADSAGPEKGATAKTDAHVRATRRLFDGAPPVIPHPDFGPHCVACHTTTGLEVPDIGFAPAMPHTATLGMSPKSRCNQCHVFKHTDDVFRLSSFEGLRQDLRRGKRQNPLAPPVIPHPLLMRENCRACHDGPSAREEIRCTHPERRHCTQCHLSVEAGDVWKRP
jgi:cytochrome c-type protein NapB